VLIPYNINDIKYTNINLYININFNINIIEVIYINKKVYLLHILHKEGYV